MLRLSSSRRPGAALVLAAASILGVAAGSSPAYAGSYEQVSRANGAQGSSPFDQYTRRGVASDTGRFALYTSGPLVPPQAPTLYVRDILFNTTRALSPNVSRVFGIDRTETKVLILRQTGADTDQQLVLLSTIGGPAKTLGRFDAFSSVDAALSGDGNIVAIHEFSYATGEAVSSTKLVNLRTGATTAVPSGGRSLRLGERSLSDDGKVLAGTVDLDRGFYYAGGKFVDTPENTWVSPSGSVVAYSHATEAGASPSELRVIRPTDGRTRTYPYPADARSGSPSLAWISPDGQRIAINADAESKRPARVVNLATGQWSPFGGPYARSLTAPLGDSLQTPASTISRGGQYALIDYASGNGNGQQALVDLAGRDLVGAQEPLSASSYVRAFPVLSFCGQPTQGAMIFTKADGAWLPVPKKARLEAFVDGVRVADATYTAVDGEGDQTTFTPFPVPAGVKRVVYRATVVDGFGTTVKDTQTVNVQCIGGGDDPEAAQ